MNVLIVDDDPSIRKYFSHVAEARGAENVDTASSGEEALSRVVHGDYGLITLDIEMPGMTGLDALALIRNMCPHAIIAVVSGHFPDDMSPDLAGCADLMLDKPVPMETLSKIVTVAGVVSSELQSLQELDSRSHKDCADSIA